MILVIEDKQVEIPIKMRKADTFMKRLRGLMFQRKPLVEDGLWITPCNSIHMFFMFFTIDVLFLDKDWQIIKAVEKLRPWSVIWPVKHAYHTLELPAGTIEKYQIRLGQHVELTDKEIK